MNDGFFLDIILFAMVAAFLVLRLRHVLGRRTGNQGSRDAAAKRRKESENDGNVIELADRTGAADEADEAEDLTAAAESDRSSMPTNSRPARVPRSR